MLDEIRGEFLWRYERWVRYAIMLEHQKEKPFTPPKIHAMYAQLALYVIGASYGNRRTLFSGTPLFVDRKHRFLPIWLQIFDLL